MSPFSSMLSIIFRKSWNEGILVQNVLKMISFGKRDFSTVWKVSVFEVFLVRIFPHSDWLRRNTPYLFVFCPNAGKYGHFSSSVVLTRISCYQFQPESIFQANFNLQISGRRIGVHEYFFYVAYHQFFSEKLSFLTL